MNVYDFQAYKNNKTLANKKKVWCELCEIIVPKNEIVKDSVLNGVCMDCCKRYYPFTYEAITKND